MASSHLNIPGARPPDPETDNLWASLPPLHTIKSEELIRYQLVDWNPNNPYHPRFLPGRLLVKSLFRRDYYYWIACSNPLPKKDDAAAQPSIYIGPPVSSTPASDAAQVSHLSSSADSTSQGQHGSEPSSSTPTDLTDMNPTRPLTNSFLDSNESNNSNANPPMGMSNARPGTTPTKSSLASPYSIHQDSPAESLSPTPSSLPLMTDSQKRKRGLEAEHHEARNVRADFGKAHLNADGTLAGVSEAVEGYHNLGTMGWHFRNLDENGKGC